MKLLVCIFGILVGIATAAPSADRGPYQRDISVCKMCPSVVGFLEKMTKVLESAGIDASQIVQQLKPFAEKFCDKLPVVGEDAKSKCRQLVDEKLPKIVEDIQGQKPVSAICDELFGCPQSAARQSQLVHDSTTREAKGFVKDVLCKVCPAAMKQLEVIEHIITLNNTLVNPAEIVQQLQPFADQICYSLPLSVYLHDVCRAIVDDRLPQIVQDLVNNEKPAQICSDVFDCPPSTASG